MSKLKKGWTKLSSEIVHKNPYFNLRHDKVLTPSNTKGNYFYIDMKRSVIVVAEDENKKLILVGQSRYPIGNIYSWEFVGGGVKDGENLLDVAKRELKEEAGIEAGEWKELGSFYPLNGLTKEKCFIFLAKDLKFGESENEETEDITVKKVSAREIKEMINKNEIVCGMTIATFYKYLN